MKAKLSMPAWLRYAAVVLLVLTGGLSAVAQTEEIEGGEAFYIYQNDGHFDGFFYDQVKEIRYSRFDTLGIERSEYVSQEIVTEDSVYRIMLTAIDSVSYVQPEIRFAKGVRFMRDEGLMAYYVSMSQTDDGFLLQFNSGLPTALQPKKDEVLQCTDLPDYDEVFVGKVKSVRNEDGKLVVECGYIEDIHDVFEQFITVEQVRQQPGPSGARTIRRMAGINAPRRVEGNVSDFTLFNFNHTFEAKLNLGKCDLQFTLSGGFGMNISAAYKITLSEFYIKTNLKSQMSIGTSIGVDGQFYESVDPTAIPGVGDFIAQFTKVPFPANLPILFANVLPVPFTRAEAHLNLSASLSAQVKATNFMLEVKDRWPYVDMGLNFIAPFLPYEGSGEGGLSITAQLNGSIQTGMKVPITVSTLPWVKKCCFLETGNTVYAGPKLSGNLDFDLWKAGDGIYEAMKESKVEFSLISIDNELEGTATIFGKEWATKHTKSWVYGNTTFTLFPEFDNLEFEVTGDNLDHIKCGVDVKGRTCLPESVGIGVYKKSDDNDTKFTELYDKFFDPRIIWYDGNFNHYEGGFTKMEPGEYRLRPIIAITGVESLKSLIVPVYSAEKAVTIESKELTLDPESVIMEEDGGEVTVKLRTSSAMPVNVTPFQEWIKVNVTQPDPTKGGGEMVVTVLPNDEERFRQGSISVVQMLGEGNYNQKEFTIKQYGGLQLSVSSLDIDVDGGSRTVEVLTSMSPININLNGADDWISYGLDNRNLHLTFTKNDGAQRTATITVSAWSSKHNGINTVTLTVTQKGLVNASVEPSSVSFEATGGTQRVNINLGENTTFEDVVLSTSGKQWLTAEKHDNYFNLTAMPNTEPAERETTVDVLIGSTNPDGVKNTVTLPVTVTQTFAAASIVPSELHFNANGGSQTAKIDASVYPYCGILSISGDGEAWCEANVSSNGTVTITTQPNAATLQRDCIVTCYVSGVKNPTDDQMLKMQVKVVQAGRTLEPVTPDGDKSPFNHITISALRYIKYTITDDEGTRDTIFQVQPFFRFTPQNAHFSVSYGKTENHYECVGYEEREANDSKSRATLTFDIEKKTNRVKNVRYAMDTEFLLSMYMWGVRGNSVNNASIQMTAAQLPLEVNGSEYKHGKQTVAEGFRFSSFSSILDSRTTYDCSSELGKELFPEGIDPVSEHLVYQPYGDPRDYMEIYVSYKDGQGEPFDIEFPSDEVMKSLQSAGLPVYEGSAPPTLNGTYRLSAPTLVADKMGVASELEGMTDIVIRFSGQQGENLNVNVYYIINGEATGEDGDHQAIIMGSGNNFTLSVPDGYGGAMLLSGQVSGSDIVNLHYATTDMEKPDDYFIIKDGNGTSSKTTWSPGAW